jgi:hypothetical protein
MEIEVQHRPERLVALYDVLWAERFRTVMFIAGSLAVAALVWLLLGGRVLPAGVFGASLAVVVAGQLVRETLRRQVAAQLASFGAQPLRYHIDDEGLRETSSIGDCQLRWHAFDRPRELGGFLVLPRHPKDVGQVIALPLESLPADARQAIEDRVAAASTTRVG